MTKGPKDPSTTPDDVIPTDRTVVDAKIPLDDVFQRDTQEIGHEELLTSEEVQYEEDDLWDEATKTNIGADIPKESIAPDPTKAEGRKPFDLFAEPEEVALDSQSSADQVELPVNETFVLQHAVGEPSIEEQNRGGTQITTVPQASIEEQNRGGTQITTVPQSSIEEQNRGGTQITAIPEDTIAEQNRGGTQVTRAPQNEGPTGTLIQEPPAAQGPSGTQIQSAPQMSSSKTQTGVGAPTQRDAAPALSSDVEEMEDVWENFDESDLDDWASQSYGGSSQTGTGHMPNNEGNILRQNTNIVSMNQVQGATGQEEARLVCLTGNAHGLEFPVTDQDITIGRSPECVIVVKDKSISRHHATIVKNEDVYVVVDNRSGNGTFVNGQRVDRARLKSGDELVFGNVIFRFIEVGDVFKPESVSRVERSPLEREEELRQQNAEEQMAKVSTVPIKPPPVLIAGSVVVTLFAAVVVGLVLRNVMHASQRTTDLAMAEEQYSKGIEAFKAKQWNQAKDRFLILQQLDPNNQFVARYVKHIEIEFDVQQRLEVANKTLDRGDLAGALEVLERVPENTMYAQEIETLKNQVDLDIQARMGEVQRLLEQGKYREAMEQSIRLRQLLPQSTFKVLDKVYLEAQQKLTNPQAPTPTIVKHQVKMKPEPRSSAIPRNEGDVLVRRALSLFNSGGMIQAINYLEGKGAHQGNTYPQVIVLYKKILGFQKAFEVARTDYETKDVNRALRTIRTAMSWEAKVTNGKGSHYQRQLGHWLAGMHYLKGMQSLKAKDNAEAYQQFTTALTYQSDHSLSKRQLKKLERRAQDLFQQGYILKNSDPVQARKKWREVITIVSPSNLYYQKAKNYLQHY